MDKIYKIPAGTYFWSVGIQLNICCDQDLYVKVTHMYEGKPHFGMLQLRFENLALQFLIGEQAIGYTDKHNGEISIDFTKCILMKDNTWIK